MQQKVPCDYEVFPSQHPPGWERLQGVSLPPEEAERIRRYCRRWGKSLPTARFLYTEYYLPLWAKWASADRARRLAAAEASL